jgi:hypothetical protein
MNSPVDPKSPGPPVECVMCREPVRPGARICTHCNSFQDWKRYFSVGSTVLALLVALLSVATTAAPALQRIFTRDRSDLRVALLSTEGREGSASVINSGNKPGFIGQIYLLANGVRVPGLKTSFKFGRGDDMKVNAGEVGTMHFSFWPICGYEKRLQQLLGSPTVKLEVAWEAVQYEGKKTKGRLDGSALNAGAIYNSGSCQVE